MASPGKTLLLTNEQVLYRDEFMIAINKPAGLPVHRNHFMPKDAPYLLKSVGQLTGKSVYNIHRLDSLTTGVVILAFDRQTVEAIASQFRDQKVEKLYHAVVYGDIEETGVFSFPVSDKNRRKKMEAVTRYRCQKTGYLDLPFQDKPSIRINLVEIRPETGKWHQIRQHFGRSRHYILGDKKHGHKLINRQLRDQYDFTDLFLHASDLSISHPYSGAPMHFTAALPAHFDKLFTYVA